MSSLASSESLEVRLHETVQGGTISVVTEEGELPLLEGISAQVQLAVESSEVAASSRVLVLALRALPLAARHEVSFGAWAARASAIRWMAAARCKLWWMTPAWGRPEDALPTETQFLLVRYSDAEDQMVPYILFLPLVTGEFRSSLAGSRGRRLKLTSESGDEILQTAGVDPVIILVAGRNPFEILGRGFQVASKLLDGAFRVRGSKAKPAALDAFGWCTWDAFMDKALYTSLVTPDGICTGVRGFAEAGVPIRHLIIDDGWQTTGADLNIENALAKADPQSPTERGSIKVPTPSNCASMSGSTSSTDSRPTLGGRPLASVYHFYQAWIEHAPAGSLRLEAWAAICNCFAPTLRKAFVAGGIDQAKRLRSVLGNVVFEHQDGQSLRRLVGELKGNLGVSFVSCWHHLLGYWCGLEPLAEEFQELAVQCQPFVLAPGIREVEPQQRWGFFRHLEVGLPMGADGAHKLYERMHSYLRDAGIDGLKVDGQASLGQCGQGLGGGPAICRRFISALEASVQRHFGGGQCIVCMCHANENLFNYAHCNVIRACDDFLPDNPASQAAHIAHCAFNSVFLGEIAVPDWDMFHSLHPSASIHAAARAVSGGPIYVSDPPGKHDFILLRRLATADGRTLLCDGPGRPTRDSLFHDPQTDGQSALKIFNTNCNGQLGVVAAFNVQGALWDRSRRDFAIRLQNRRLVNVLVRPCDVEAFRSNHEGPNVGVAYAVYRHLQPDFVQLLPDNSVAISLQLPPESYEILTFSPVLQIATACGANVGVALIGLKEMLNPGGAIRHLNTTSGCLEVSGHGSGPFVGYASHCPVGCELVACTARTKEALILPVKEWTAPAESSKRAPVFEVYIPDSWVAEKWVLRLLW